MSKALYRVKVQNIAQETKWNNWPNRADWPVWIVQPVIPFDFLCDILRSHPVLITLRQQRIILLKRFLGK